MLAVFGALADMGPGLLIEVCRQGDSSGDPPLAVEREGDGVGVVGGTVYPGDLPGSGGLIFTMGAKIAPFS